ncbi:50S ribosomal protein L29 [Desulfosarcina sp. OttesenSCG-928-B08]|nr:50S ribosomal protein L29 [Desulfosarcina sp. OttesenSCG-928-B08]
MKVAEIRALDADAIYQKIADLKETLFNLRFQHEVGQLENPRKIGQTKKDIARLKTILNEQRKPLKEE